MSIPISQFYHPFFMLLSLKMVLGAFRESFFHGQLCRLFFKNKFYWSIISLQYC